MSSHQPPQEPQLPAHFRKLELPFAIGSGRTLFSGLEPERLWLRLYSDEKKKEIAGRVWFGKSVDGPPGYAHGGALAYVLDETMGSACWAQFYPVVARKLEFEYLEKTPLYLEHHLQAEIQEVRGRNVVVEGRVLNQQGRTTVIARGEFTRLRKAQIEEILGADAKAIAERLQINPDQFHWATEADSKNSRSQ